MVGWDVHRPLSLILLLESKMKRVEIIRLAADAIDAKCRLKDSYQTIRLTELLIQATEETSERKALVDKLLVGTSENAEDYSELLREFEDSLSV